MAEKKVNVAIIGLGFGAEFIPIYQRHPNANMAAICQRREDKLNAVGDAFGIEKRYTDYDELLKDPEIDAVHINTPIHEHARMSVAGLRAGKHVACTVPMGTTLDELKAIVDAQAESGKKYMMMETVIYSREFLYVKELYDTGKLGRIQYLRATHQQEMLGWPGYWEGLPPMHYATHVVSPCLALAGHDAEYVACFGSGRIQEDLIPKYSSPFAIETAHIKMKDSDLVAEVMRSLFNTARQYRESFDVYGSKMSFEWPLIEHDHPVVHIGETPHHVSVLDFAHRLPEPIQRFTTKGVYGGEQQHLSFIQGSGHGGSHPHLAHQFLMSIAEDRKPFPDARQSANWTAVGILAHESALKGGERLYLPDWSLS
ncbi:Gfo/Idh/MocA family protein [Aggregatilinea lenta]|uniref:Gfo/Idh/MocA family protein n=1 Tax=Aggregatilinea lenta TaxID=913108 RepID=UPI000E5A1C8B|nr:Gfo/Idh/MocA family oxidoreductase [Aggregatilinea lenta]